jgi:putative RecB family exonuclease
MEDTEAYQASHPDTAAPASADLPFEPAPDQVAAPVADPAAGLPGEPSADGAAARVPAARPAPAQLPMALSPSRASDFMTCPQLFRFRVIDKLPERKSAAATRGTLVHAVLERLFDLPSGERTPTAASGLLEPEWLRMLADDPELKALADEAAGGPEGWLADAVTLLERYFRLEDPNRLEPAERELYVHTRIGGDLMLRGYVDRLDVAPDGALRVVDYKTGRAPGPAFEGKALFQMKFYALVLWKTRGVVPRRLQLMYLGDGQKVIYDPDEADLRATERKIAALWAAIRNAAERGNWPANPSRLCDWCDHKAVCPAFGGTPPPLPEVTLVSVPDSAPGRGSRMVRAEAEAEG